MSGIEVAGVILAVFPVVVEGLELYVKGVRTIKRWWSFSKVLQRLLRGIERERAKFSKNCQALLFDITKPGQLKRLMADPAGPECSQPDLQRKLEKKLRDSYRAYMETASEIKELLETLLSRLELDQSGKPKWRDERSYRKEWKRIQITRAEPANQSSLDQLRKNNDDLQTLLGHRSSMPAVREPDARSAAHAYQLQRAQASSFHIALCRQFARGCDCAVAHGARMCLSRNRISFRPDCLTTEDEIDKHSHFGVLFSLHSANSPAEIASPWVRKWCETMVENIELVREDATSSRDSGAQGGPVTPPHTPLGSLSLRDAPIVAREAPDRELCAALKSKTTSPDGLITLKGDPKRRHRVDLMDRFGISSSTAVVSLREALIQGLERKLRLALAVKLASAVLQLQTTSWMSQWWNSSHVFLLQPDNSRPQLGHAFVSAAFSGKVPNNASKAPIQPTGFPMETRNASLFALGITLIELWFGRTLASLHPKTDGTAMSIGEMFVAAKSASEDIYREAGEW
ncbi:uncharacterized protein RHO25_002220 [Cercospora beticola]|uniref:DUF7580 domain-containing protein n=1 Tax=Cercospora beticola TaxID=122368 RepID=A0ABZ0NDJ9_CERBT|nr:hypothetical protein RHO25_002220 [Cercospora beticola]